MSHKPHSPEALPLGETHAVTNVSSDLENYNLFTSDQVLMDGLAAATDASGIKEAAAFGATIGTAEFLELGHLANKYKPELDTHDRFGRRVDLVRYHDAYHRLMCTSLENGLHSQPWTDTRPGAFALRAAKSMMMSQVEAGHGCPITMTFASIPSIRMQPDIAEIWEPKILARGYDPRSVPAAEKQAVTIGMGMTEKQGGSDVRQNTTRAEPLGAGGPGQRYRLLGHKWFLSAPMCDAFLVLAQAEAGISCFLVPRWLPEGEKNALHVIRLKDKMGNCSNASSEVEFRGAHGWLIGEEGRGVHTIIEMVSLTRVDCMGGSAGILRAGLANAIHHCRQRAAFGRTLIDQPLMQNLLADLALEYEGAIAMALRMARALEGREHGDEHEASLLRMSTAVGKYWICKRAPQYSYEVMEVIGGSGVMENSIFPRLYRESVINPIWEGSGNVQCLDVLRAAGKSPASVSAFVAELEAARGGHRLLDEAIDSLKQDFAGLAKADYDSVQFGARALVDRMATAQQAALLVQQTPTAVSDAFCASRLGAQGHHNYGALPVGTDVQAILRRADPGIDRELPAAQARRASAA